MNKAGFTRQQSGASSRKEMNAPNGCKCTEGGQGMQALGSYMAMMASQLQQGLSNIEYWQQLQQCFDFRTF